MSRTCQNILFSCVILVLFSAGSKALSRTIGDLTLTNETDKSLCVYVGNNVLTCQFIPNAKLKLRIPTKVTYNGQAASVSSVKITNTTDFITNSDGVKTQKNVTLCQIRTFSPVTEQQWQVREGKDSDCSVNPIYPKDFPSGIDR